MADYLKNFREDETIKASDTNSNNQFLLDRINSVHERLKTWLDGEIGRINSNIQSGDATLQTTIDALKKTTEDTPHFAEKYQSGNSWYRIQSDGWLEQGGIVPSRGSVTYVKPFKDTNYTLVLGTHDTNFEHGGISGKSATGFSHYDGKGWSYIVEWYACGFMAE